MTLDAGRFFSELSAWPSSAWRSWRKARQQRQRDELAYSFGFFRCDACGHAYGMNPDCEACVQVIGELTAVMSATGVTAQEASEAFRKLGRSLGNVADQLKVDEAPEQA